jgi:thiol:disulfide interchange protein DsbD
MKSSIAPLFLSLGLAAHPLIARAAPVRDGHVQAELVSETASIAPGQSFWVGVRLQMDSAWHVNWLNPGDAGLPPSIRWTIPAGFRAGEVHWPFPENISQGSLAIFGYEDEVLLMVEVTPPADLPDRIPISARVDWVACGDVCMPGGADLRLELNTSRNRTQPNSRWVETFADARSMLPMEQSGIAVKADVTEKAFELSFALPESWSVDLGDVRFFPFANGLIDNAAGQQVDRRDHSLRLTVPRARNNPTVPDRIAGVVVSSTGWRGAGSERSMAFDVSLGDAPYPLDTTQDQTSHGR